MIEATLVRVGNVIKTEGKLFKVITQEMRGTGKFGKTVHCKLKSLEDAAIAEKSFRAEDKLEDVPVHFVKMQYLYREGDRFVFMNMETYEQHTISAKSVGRHEASVSTSLAAAPRICDHGLYQRCSSER